MLVQVVLDASVCWVSMSHALSSEREEIMGLLLGDWFEVQPGRYEARIWDVTMLSRSDKRSDRVEISPEQLAMAQQEAEEISLRLGKTTRVLGWYHSHPKITVLPSHVDVRTQASYQLMDDRFVGLIFSCFYQDKDFLNKIQITAFQALQTGSEPKFPFMLTGRNLFEEEKTAFHTRTDLSQVSIHTLHNGAVYMKSLTCLIDKVCGPPVFALEQRHLENLKQIAQLEHERDELKRALGMSN